MIGGGLRNVLAHGYAVVNDNVVWAAASRGCPIFDNSSAG